MEKTNVERWDKEPAKNNIKKQQKNNKTLTEITGWLSGILRLPLMRQGIMNRAVDKENYKNTSIRHKAEGLWL